MKSDEIADGNCPTSKETLRVVRRYRFIKQRCLYERAEVNPPDSGKDGETDSLVDLPLSVYDLDI